MKSGFLGSPNRRILLGVAERDGGSARQLVQSYSAVMGGGAIITPTPGTPTLKSLTPNVGPQGGGTSVTIIGQNFFGTGIQVFFGGTACPTVTVNSPTQLTVLTPAHATGAVSVVVVTSFGVGLLLFAYTYQAPNPVMFAIGDNNAAMSSLDGKTWQATTVAGSGINWLGLIWNGAKFAAISMNGAHSMTSSNGLTWALGPSGPGVTWPYNGNSFIWDGSRFVAVGNSGGTFASAISLDGITWSYFNSGYPSDGSGSLAFNGALYVSWGRSAGELLRFTSGDAQTWTEFDQQFGVVAGNLATGWNGSQFISMAYPSGGMYYSSDGSHWTQTPMPGESAGYLGVAWNGSIWVAVGAGGIATSSDGINWSAQTVPSPAPSPYTYVIWSPGLSLYIAVGFNGASYSPDGINWTAATGVPAGNYRSVASMV